MVFTNLENADNKVSREVLYRYLGARGVPVAYTMVIKNMYNGATTRVRTVGGDPDHFQVVMGLLQGSTLCSFLFALVIDELVRHIKGEMP